MIKNYFENVLIIGSGPVGLNLYIYFKKGYAAKVGLKVRNSISTKQLLLDLKKNNGFIESIAANNEIASITGKYLLENLYLNFEELSNEWNTLILCVPCDTYLSIIKSLNLKRLNKIKKIILISPEFGSSLILKKYIDIYREIEIISFSSYFGASNFYNGNHCLVITNALKKYVYIGSTSKNSISLKKILMFLSDFNVKCICCKNQLEAESKNITIFVHSPFLLNKVSLDQSFGIDKVKRFLYKLYPEGPITKDIIHKMIRVYIEILELYEKMNISKLNLLKFLNDSYPVLENSISKYEIKNFMKFGQLKKEYLLYVRYTSILIDPFSKPDKEGRYFDFSRVEYSKVYKDNKKFWRIPRRPLEDYNKLNLIWHLTKMYETKSEYIFELIKIYKEYYSKFSETVGEKNIEEDSRIREREEEAQIIKLYLENHIYKNYSNQRGVNE